MKDPDAAAAALPGASAKRGGALPFTRLLAGLGLAALSCLGFGRAMEGCRDSFWESTREQTWGDLKGPLGSSLGVVAEPPPLAARSMCWGFQDATCTVLLHYRAPDAQAVLVRNGFTLGALRPAQVDPSERDDIVGQWHAAPVRQAHVAGLGPLKLSEHHRAERSLQWLELDDGTVVLSISWMEL